MSHRFSGILLFSVIGFFMMLGGCLTNSSTNRSVRFQALYNYYFPKNTESVTSLYRKWFDEIVFSPDVPADVSKNDMLFRQAMHGDATAFHAFVHSYHRSASGEFGETWSAQCVLLLLMLDDERFARFLVVEDGKTNGYVRNALRPIIDWKTHRFPKTQAIVFDR
ncbi:MAG: hypothetical protein WC003_14100 [Terrimicrobiaceae bacterium]